MAESTKTQEPVPALRKKYLGPDLKPVVVEWGHIHSKVASYEESFKSVLEGRTIPSLIRNRPSPVVMDLMAPPATVHELLQDFPGGRGLAVSLPDHSLRDEPQEVKDAYNAAHVTWLPGDLTRLSTWGGIARWLNGQRADLIMERASGGLEWIPNKKLLFGFMFNEAWSMLSPQGGTMLVEIPRADNLLRMGVDIEKQVKLLKDRGMDVSFDPGGTRNILPYPTPENGKLRIVKTPDSPENIFSV